jgi:Protein of unknown function (DUF1580)
MKIPKSETPLLVVDAVLQATGQKISRETAWRWRKHGNRYGIKLETWLMNNRRVTSVQRVRAFNERTTAASEKRAATC